jgi:hypothetical protein
MKDYSNYCGTVTTETIEEAVVYCNHKFPMQEVRLADDEDFGQILVQSAENLSGVTITVFDTMLHKQVTICVDRDLYYKFLARSKEVLKKSRKKEMV